MSFFKQLLATVVFLAGAVALWVTYVPSAMPMLDRLGVLDRLGIEAPARDAAATPGAGARRGGGGPVAVIARPVAARAFNDQVVAIGDGRAFRSVMLMPETSGRIETLAAFSGSRVEAGSIVATLESAAQVIAVDRAQLMLEDAQATLDRLARLESSGAVPEIQANSAQLALATAELALRDAEFELARRQIVAPISGWVGILSVDEGDQVAPGTELTRIDDRSRIMVEFRVPERFVSQISEGSAVSVTPLSQPGRVLEGTISALDNRVDPGSRTLRVQALVPNDDDTLRAGMAFRITLAFEGETYPAVDPLAIQWNSDGAFVWTLRDGKAMRAPVRIVQRNSDAVLVEADLAPGDMIVTEGVQNLRPGAEVAVQPAAAADLDAAPAPSKT